MSVFDLFRGFFGFPEGHYRGRRDPFFDAMTHDEDEDDGDEEDGFYYDGFRGEQQDPFDSAWRFGFSFGPDGMRIQEPPLFGQLLKEMEDMFSQIGQLDRHSDSGYFGVPRIMPPPPQGRGPGEGNPLRDFMLKTPNDSRPQQPTEPTDEPRPLYESPFYGRTPFSKFGDMWRQEPHRVPEDLRKEDRDLDSAVSAKGLDQILPPPAGHTPNQPRTRSFFQSVTVTKVVKPDGTVEERRTVRDGQGNETTTVTRSGPDHEAGPVSSDLQWPFSDMRDDNLFSKFFGGFK